MVKVGVIVLHYKDWESTKKCLVSLDNLSKDNIDLTLLLVNNSQEDVSLPNLNSRLIFEKTTQNLGYAGGNNVGIKRFLFEGVDWIWIVNNDVVVDKKSLFFLLKAIQSRPKAGILSPKILFEPGKEYHKTKYQKSEQGKVIWWAGGMMDWNNLMTIHRGVDEVDHGQYNITSQTESVTGTSMLVKSDVFRKIGLFDERYYLYFEESDFCQRAKLAGFELWYVPKAIVWHANAASSGVGSELHDYYLTRNRLLFGFTYMRKSLIPALIKDSLRIFFTGRKWQKIAVWDFFMRRFNKGSYSIG